MTVIGILRGLRPENAVAVGTLLYDTGLRVLEVPLNSPEPLRSISRLRDALPADCAVGAGTVLTPDDVHRVQDAGGNLIVSPNTDPEVIAATVAAGLASYPGAATPTEAMTAVRAGCTGVKVFPALQVGASGVRAWREVLPGGTDLLPVGGVAIEDLADWLAAGCTGFGFGSALFRPGLTLEQLRANALRILAAYDVASSATRSAL
jgi:2-dehydro-3-deoxyphosphogalactonate aldolase